MRKHLHWSLDGLTSSSKTIGIPINSLTRLDFISCGGKLARGRVSLSKLLCSEALLANKMLAGTRVDQDLCRQAVGESRHGKSSPSANLSAEKFGALYSKLSTFFVWQYLHRVNGSHEQTIGSDLSDTAWDHPGNRKQDTRHASEPDLLGNLCCSSNGSRGHSNDSRKYSLCVAESTLVTKLARTSLVLLKRTRSLFSRLSRSNSELQARSR